MTGDCFVCQFHRHSVDGALFSLSSENKEGAFNSLSSLVWGKSLTFCIRALMTQKSCTVGMLMAKLGNHHFLFYKFNENNILNDWKKGWNNAGYLKTFFQGRRWINNQRKSNFVWYNTPHWKIIAFICCAPRSRRPALFITFLVSPCSVTTYQVSSEIYGGFFLLGNHLKVPTVEHCRVKVVSLNDSRLRARETF